MPRPPVQPDPAAYSAAREACRAAAPDVFFACHLLPRPERHAVYTLAVLWDQLRQIIDAPVEAPTEGNGEPGSQLPEGVVAGCVSCGGDSVEQRQAVGVAVLDFLYSG